MKLRKIFIVLFVLVASMAQAQMNQAIPADPSIRMGKLDNGLTYYIRHNEHPEHVANFYIAQRVGSIQEEEEQRGLAHFLEHMAFNGSDNFKENGIIDFTRSLGVAFGRDLNAYTSIEETVYNINNVPTTRTTALDSCLLILRDWSCGLELKAEEIDKERGVIHGEWAMRNSAGQRLFERNLPAMYPGSKYGERMPIGLMSVVDNFQPEALRSYYRKWYHPENQAIIVVGDIDVDHIEAVIKEYFSPIKAGPEAAHVTPVAVPDNNEAIYIFDKDKEMPYSEIDIFLKSDALPDEMRGTIMQYVSEYASNALIPMMFNSRMSELAQNPESPFTAFHVSYGKYLLSHTKDALSVEATPKEGKERETLAAVVRELKRVKEHGFTGSEFVRAKEEFLSRCEKEYQNRDKREHEELYRQCVENFLHRDAMPDPETDYQLCQMLAQQLPLEMINEAAKEMFAVENDTNFVCLLFAQDKEGLTHPSTDDMRQIVAQARAEQVAAWVDNTKDEPLIATLPKAGKIVKETENKALGYTELKLSNGARVILKKTDFKDNEIALGGWAKGGKALYGAADYSNLKLFDAAVSAIGLGNFTNNELEKALAGKQANVSLNLGNRYAMVNGGTTPKDLETLMQLLYLHFTAIQKDEKAYNQLYTQLETVLKNRDLRPETALSDTLTLALNCNNDRFAPLTMDDLSKISYDRMLKIAKEQYSDAKNFTFLFTGNFDEAKIREYICQYIASLPGKAKEAKDSDIRTYFSGDIKKDFKRKMETPKPMVVEVYKSEIENTLENQVLADYAGEVLSMILLKTVREDAGAAYTISASAGLSTTPEKTYALMQIYAPISAPEKLDDAIRLITEGVNLLAKEADSDMVDKVKANLLKQFDVDVKDNNKWESMINSYLMEGLDVYTDYKKVVESVTPAKVAAFLKDKILAAKNHLTVVMRPEE